MVVFSLLFAIACAGVWEIWEFSTDQIFGFTAQNNSLHDTMWDIICGTVAISQIGGPVYVVGADGRALHQLDVTKLTLPCC